jgi:hypothetical protein
VIDPIRERRPPFSTDDVVIEFAALLKSYGVRDVTGDPVASRKAMLIEVIVRAQLGLRFNEHLEGHGPIVFKHACSRPFESASVAV